MACSTPKIKRIAVGAFNDAGRLGEAFGALQACSIEPMQLCLIGTPAVLAGWGAIGKVPIDCSLTPDRCKDLGALSDGEPLVAAMPAVVAAGANDLEPMEESKGLLHGLEAALAHGAVALMVSARTVAEFAEATRVLLRYGSIRVRTREVVDPFI